MNKTSKQKSKRISLSAARIDNRSFLALLIRSFLIFMLLTVLAVSLVFYIAIWASNRGDIETSSRNFANYKNHLAEGKYSSIPAKKLFGKEGWLCIVDAQGHFVYSSDGVERNFTASQLGFIADFGSTDVVTARKFKMQNGEYHHLISRTAIRDGETVEEYLVLDSDLHIISGSIPQTISSFTQTEFEYYTYNTTYKDRKLEKYDFKYDGGNYYAVILDCDLSSGVSPYIFAVVAGVSTLALLAVSLALYIRYINKHVTKPLNSLGAAMTNFSANKYLEKLSYSGTKEFEQLVDSFNEMSDMLNTSEKQRTALENDRQRMLAGLSHDLKTPMTVIQGFSKALADGLVTGEEAEKYLKIILDKSEHMSALINEFYEFSKLDHPDFTLNKSDEDIAEYVRKYIAGRYEEFEIRGGNIDADIPEDCLTCSVDGERLTRVFDNIVSNFFKYTPEGSTLYVRLKRQDDNALIIFADNGGGISEDVRDEIFTPFVVGEQSRNKQGSGLGLAVCKKIITLHGGSISLNPTPDEDWKTEFDISLPLSK